MSLINRNIKIAIFDVHQLPARSVGCAASLFRVPPGSTTVRAQFTCVLKRQVTRIETKSGCRYRPAHMNIKYLEFIFATPLHVSCGRPGYAALPGIAEGIFCTRFRRAGR
jgi:hypothetical protein